MRICPNCGRYKCSYFGEPIPTQVAPCHCSPGVSPIFQPAEETKTNYDPDDSLTGAVLSGIVPDESTIQF